MGQHLLGDIFSSVHLILAIAKLHNLDSKAIDFVLAFPQAYLEEDIWMYLPIGFQVDGHTNESSECRYLLKLKKVIWTEARIIQLHGP